MTDSLFYKICDDLASLAVEDPDRSVTYLSDESIEDVVRCVLMSLRDHTPSPRTVDEVTRVLGEGE